MVSVFSKCLESQEGSNDPNLGPLHSPPLLALLLVCPLFLSQTVISNPLNPLRNPHLPLLVRHLFPFYNLNVYELMFLSAFYVLHFASLFLTHFPGNGSSKHILEERPEGSESSDGEFDVKPPLMLLFDFHDRLCYCILKSLNFKIVSLNKQN